MFASPTTSAVEIRPLTAADANAWWHLRLEALERDPEAFSATVEAHHKLSVGDIQTRLRSDPAEHFVVGAFADGQLVGTAGFVREQGLKERHKGRIWGVYLTASLRAKGVGRDLMDALLQRAVKIDGLEQIVLSVAVTQTAATALYRSVGFTPFGCEPKALKIGDRYIDEEYMVLRLVACDRTADPSSG